MADLIRELAQLYPAHLETIRSRFERALGAAGYRGALVHSGTPPGLFRDDQSYPFKVNAAFKMWVPLTQVPDCFVYFGPGRVPLLLFHSPTDYWHKAADLPRAYWTDHFDIRPAADITAARSALPRDLSQIAFIGEPFKELETWHTGPANPAPLMNRLDFDRAAKTPYELACLREASRLGARGHLAAERAFRAGASEFEIELAFLAACGQREQELPYNPIIALNEGGAVLHYQVLDRARPTPLRSLLIDAGAEFAGFGSDITRTHAFDDSDFASLVSRFDELQQSLCASVRAGVDWRDVHLAAHHAVARLLRESDIIYCDADEAVATRVSSVFLPHGLGHLLGLQVHDVGGFMRSPEGDEIPRPEGHPFLRLTRVLQEGFVVTMEPGMYFIDQLLDEARADTRGKQINWNRVENLRKFGGIRIEDDLAITASGCENLTRNAFREVSAMAVNGAPASRGSPATTARTS